MLLLGDRGAGNNKNSNNQKANSNPSTLRRSSSTNRKQVSIRARYWAYLFDNLRRAVDEIYAICDTDSSVVECKVIIDVNLLFISLVIDLGKKTGFFFQDLKKGPFIGTLEV